MKSLNKKSAKKKPTKLDWKLKLLQLLKCVGESGGTLFEANWESYGVSRPEALIIIEAFEKQYPELTQEPDSADEPSRHPDQQGSEDQPPCSLGSHQ